VYIPLTIAVVGKRLWIKYRFTNKRVQIINSSPLFAKQVRTCCWQDRLTAASVGGEVSGWTKKVK